MKSENLLGRWEMERNNLVVVGAIISSPSWCNDLYTTHDSLQWLGLSFTRLENDQETFLVCAVNEKPPTNDGRWIAVTNHIDTSTHTTQTCTLNLFFIHICFFSTTLYSDKVKEQLCRAMAVQSYVLRQCLRTKVRSRALPFIFE